MDPLLMTRMLRIRRRTASPPRDDEVAVEEPLELRVRGGSLVLLMRTPGDDRELVAGFLWNEGVLRSRTDLLDITHCGEPDSEPEPHVLIAHLAEDVDLREAETTRFTYAGSSCGLCGKTSIEAVRRTFPPLNSDLVIESDSLVRLLPPFRRSQESFRRSGGLHAAAVFDSNGSLRVLREDVGRHNAVDKVVGFCFFRDRLPLHDRGLMVSGRVSFEIMQKAMAAGIPLVAGISAPTSLAVEFAKTTGQTLVGFLREEGMNVYSGSDRILVRGKPAAQAGPEFA